MQPQKPLWKLMLYLVELTIVGTIASGGIWYLAYRLPTNGNTLDRAALFHVGLAFNLILMGIIAWVNIHDHFHPTSDEEEDDEDQHVYEVGSPEHNAQIIAGLAQMNQRLAPLGRRIPERTAIDIIMQQYEESEEPYSNT